MALSYTLHFLQKYKGNIFSNIFKNHEILLEIIQQFKLKTTL